ncbi:MAG: transglycosylase SLT domain-containing protein [Pseudobdellovibrionaceae bacterium]
MAHKKNILIIALSFLAISCSKGFQSASSLDLDHQASQEGPTDPADPPIPPPTIPIQPPPPEEETPFQFEALMWETVKPGTKPWSTFTFDLLQTVATDIVKAQDMSRFCKKYSFLNDNQKINVAGQLIAAIVKYESGFNPLSRFHESNMGTDPITGKPVYSEGLMQLSYQDIQGYPFCKFDWAKDKNLKVDDPKKTILDPYINLACGVQILSRQVKRKGFIVVSSGAYWAVIKENGRFEKIDEIAAIVNSLKMCQ